MSTYTELEKKVREKQKRNNIEKKLLQQVRDMRRKIQEKQQTQKENPESILENI